MTEQGQPAKAPEQVEMTATVNNYRVLTREDELRITALHLVMQDRDVSLSQLGKDDPTEDIAEQKLAMAQKYYDWLSGGA